MTRRFAALASLATLVAGFASAPAAAATFERVAWSMPASACTIVDGETLADMSTGRVRFLGNATGQIRLVCPITDLRAVAGAPIVPNAIFVTFLDTSGPNTKGSSNFVAAWLMRMSLANASVVTMAGVSSETTTNTSGRHAAAFPASLPAAERALQFDTNAYMVEVTLQRDDPTLSLSVFAVGLSNRVAPAL